MTNELRDARRLGGYILPGGVSDPRPAIEQARAADELGLGTIWLSERWGAKDVPVIFGALSQTTRSVRLGAGTMHFQDRHPLVLASTAAALQSFSDGRFLMGVGKLIPRMWAAAGVPDATNAVLADTADIVRRLLRGETVSYDGPAGHFPELRLMGALDVPPPPILITAIGPKTLAVAGSRFDGAILHAFLTPDAVRRSVEHVRAAAADAGRNPDDVRIYGMVVVASDLPAEQESRIVAARAVTYFDSDPLGSVIFEANGWDKAPLMALRSHPLVAASRRTARRLRANTRSTRRGRQDDPRGVAARDVGNWHTEGVRSPTPRVPRCGRGRAHPPRQHSGHAPPGRRAFVAARR